MFEKSMFHLCLYSRLFINLDNMTCYHKHFRESTTQPTVEYVQSWYFHSLSSVSCVRLRPVRFDDVAKFKVGTEGDAFFYSGLPPLSLASSSPRFHVSGRRRSSCIVPTSIRPSSCDPRRICVTSCNYDVPTTTASTATALSARTVPTNVLNNKIFNLLSAAGLGVIKAALWIKTCFLGGCTTYPFRRCCWRIEDVHHGCSAKEYSRAGSLLAYLPPLTRIYAR